MGLICLTYTWHQFLSRLASSKHFQFFLNHFSRVRWQLTMSNLFPTNPSSPLKYERNVRLTISEFHLWSQTVVEIKFVIFVTFLCFKAMKFVSFRKPFRDTKAFFYWYHLIRFQNWWSKTHRSIGLQTFSESSWKFVLDEHILLMILLFHRQVIIVIIIILLLFTLL